MLTDKQYVWKRYITGFADIMIKQLAAHGDRGNSWEKEEPEWLLNRAREELEELAEELKYLKVADAFLQRKAQCKKVAKECADVANFMMMIVDAVKE